MASFFPALNVQEAPICWRVICWMPDGELTEKQKDDLVRAVPEIMARAGEAVAFFTEEQPDRLMILLAHTRFPVETYRSVATWISAGLLSEYCIHEIEDEGAIYISGEMAEKPETPEDIPELLDFGRWWDAVAPIPRAEQNEYRTGIATQLKRGQYQAAAGYLSRVLRKAENPGKVCPAMVIAMLEAVFSLFVDIDPQQLIAELNLEQLARRPKETLLQWVSGIAAILREHPVQLSDAPIERAVNAIRVDCSLPYSQKNLSKSLGISPAYFCRLFSQTTGQCFSAFLIQTRMEKAKEMLRHGGYTLQQVADSCGYPVKSYFCQVFRRYTGMTTSEFEAKNHS